MYCQITSRNIASRTDPTYKVELRGGLGYRRDVLEDGTNILCRNAGGRLLIDAKQRNRKTESLIWNYAVRTSTRPGGTSTATRNKSWCKRV
jgi:hypothetical protein